MSLSVYSGALATAGTLLAPSVEINFDLEGDDLDTLVTDYIVTFGLASDSDTLPTDEDILTDTILCIERDSSLSEPFQCLWMSYSRDSATAGTFNVSGADFPSMPSFDSSAEGTLGEQWMIEVMTNGGLKL